MFAAIMAHAAESRHGTEHLASASQHGMRSAPPRLGHRTVQSANAIKVQKARLREMARALADARA
jgi:hypothetical protein